jgi:hypothetical protein
METARATLDTDDDGDSDQRRRGQHARSFLILASENVDGDTWVTLATTAGSGRRRRLLRSGRNTSVTDPNDPDTDDDGLGDGRTGALDPAHNVELPAS